MSEDYLAVCSQEMKHRDAAKNRAVAAFCWGAAVSPVCVIKGTPLVQESYQYLSQACQLKGELAHQNYDAAVEPGLTGAGLYIAIVLPIAFLLRNRSKHLSAAEKAHEKRQSLEDRAVKEERRFQEWKEKIGLC